MKLSPKYKMQFKRRRLGKTDYQRRLKLLSSDKPRLVVRRSLNYITVQIVKSDKKGDNILAGITSKQLKKYNWKFACDNLPAAYLTGLLIGKLSEKKIK
jgi:large subunit ribosomal protein L18